MLLLLMMLLLCVYNISNRERMHMTSCIRLGSQVLPLTARSGGCKCICSQVLPLTAPWSRCWFMCAGTIRNLQQQHYIHITTEENSRLSLLVHARRNNTQSVTATLCTCHNWRQFLGLAVGSCAPKQHAIRNSNTMYI